MPLTYAHPVWWNCGEDVLANTDATRWSASSSQSGSGTPSCSHEAAQHAAWHTTSTAVSLLGADVSVARMFSNTDMTIKSTNQNNLQLHVLVLQT
jgi:hypothetical protein